jgi:hypothetical protein
MAYVALDPERAPLIADAFRLYATGEYTIERLADELEHRGFRTRPWRTRPASPLSYNGLRWVLAPLTRPSGHQATSSGRPHHVYTRAG